MLGLLFTLAGALSAQTAQTGPAVGDSVPGFELIDQNGTAQTPKSLMGPNGLMLVFFRSADW
ncbi:MAG: hypothetical protein LAO79_03445 [Acidobacteriia bacterium]|nr:hypothetical protein [Terriglobia bacterium]